MSDKREIILKNIVIKWPHFTHTYTVRRAPRGLVPHIDRQRESERQRDRETDTDSFWAPAIAQP